MTNLQFGTFEHQELNDRITSRGIGEIRQIRFYSNDKDLLRRKSRTQKSIFDVPHQSKMDHIIAKERYKGTLPYACDY